MIIQESILKAQEMEKMIKEPTPREELALLDKMIEAQKVKIDCLKQSLCGNLSALSEEVKTLRELSNEITALRELQQLKSLKRATLYYAKAHAAGA